jgi:hypothetical protein
MEKKTENKSKTWEIILTVAAVVIILIGAYVVISKTCIDCWGLGKKKITTTDQNIEEKLNELLVEKGTKMVIGLEGEKMMAVKPGTENFGIPFAFSPTTPDAWGMNNERCKYFISIVNQASYCVNKGWESPEKSITTEKGNVKFDSVKNNIGYAIIKINIPENLPPCIQRFKITVKCTALTEATTDYFDLNVVDEIL